RSNRRRAGALSEFLVSAQELLTGDCFTSDIELPRKDEQRMFSGKTFLAVAVGSAALIGAAAGAVTVAVVGASSPTTTVTKTVGETVPTTATSNSGALTVNQIYRQASPGVVELTVTSQASVGPFGDSQEQQAQGSGFVYDRQGHIVTDEHVVDGAQSISV